MIISSNEFVRLKIFVMILAITGLLTACQKKENISSLENPDIFQTPVSAEPLPENIEWLTNEADPEYASPQATRGGTFHAYVLNFPLTFRTIGPDANSSFRDAILGNQMALIGIHPNTDKLVPELATHWAYGIDKKTMYFKLNQQARWSDGVPVTAQDFAYTLEFMRSPHIVDPWYNDYYTKDIEKVIVFDDYTLAVVATKPIPDLHLTLSLMPQPRHYYKQLKEDYVTKYNWAIVPNTGPYQIKDFKKGKNILFERKKDWWANDLKYYKNRFNVDKVVFTVIKELDLVWEYFKKQQIDAFSVTLPEYWHDKTNSDEFTKGYIHKLWFYNDVAQPSSGMYLNQDNEIFKDQNVRYAFAHAINVEKVIKTVLRDDYFQLEHGFIGYGRYTNENIRARRFNISNVETYMKKASWQRGDDGIWLKNKLRFSVEVVYSQDFHTPRLVILKEEAKKAGIELNLALLDGAAAYKKVMEKKHDVAWMAWSTSQRPQYWEHYHSENAHKPQTNNITNTDDSEMDKLIEAHRNSLDEEERINLSLEIQEKIYELGSFVPTFMVPYVRVAYWRWWRLPTPPGTKTSESIFEPFSNPVFGMCTGGMFWYDEQMHKQTQAAIKKGQVFEPVTNINEIYKMKFLKNQD